MKSILQYRLNELKALPHGGGASFVRGGLKPFTLSILTMLFLETRIPISLSSSEILGAPQI